MKPIKFYDMRPSKPNLSLEKERTISKIHRRNFLKIGAVGTLSVVALGCKKNGLIQNTVHETNPGNVINFAANYDIGLLNYIYALEQLEAAFYIKLTEILSNDFTDLQKVYFNELKLHEQTHAEYYLNVIGIQSAIGKLEFDFSSIDFSSKNAVLLAAQTFEDLGVAAYNGALERVKELSNVLILSQIATVEARHACWLRNQVSDRSGIDLDQLVELGADATHATDVSLAPKVVLQQVSKYIKTKLEILNS
ncbi:ferritin-like domain-containing protein [Pedobacter arcticus]|uniref:ferritin-like domain-containing protein n=1 Tax=Pedobacter arcticus TaxID=752140 RepID=UPI000301723F|nr:ferritin-like domain-containing protein [Pedobacter arcticus]